MGYFEDLKNLLLPLGVYEFEDGQNVAELKVLGTAFDGCEEITKCLERENNLVTAESYGLEFYEKLMPNIPAYSNLKSRRNALMALLRINDTSFTAEALNATLSGCGVKAVVRETDRQYVVEVSFPETRGIPENLSELDRRVKEILPCHIDVEYKYVFFTWNELEECFMSWNGLEAQEFSWKELEIYFAEA